MSLRKNVYEALKSARATPSCSVRQTSASSSAARSGSVHDFHRAALRHHARLKRFLAVVEQHSEDFESYISNLRQPPQRSEKPRVPLAKQCVLSSRTEPSIPLAKSCLLISSKGPGQNAVVSL
ncbi:unnamed protein product [Effrenium voratum]|uniref:Uncharacterized protein n=1 Tax=Effrenium voratum TaxID=2562239 RepID=A0AA36JHE0_9DINO|nr:unnamed protein product [Effrenium voratum]